MSSQESDQVLTLLQELSVLKALDSESEGGSKLESEPEGERSRHERHGEIVAEIKALAEQKRNAGTKSHSSETGTI
jgi:hypothetical protein